MADPCVESLRNDWNITCACKSVQNCSLWRETYLKLDLPPPLIRWLDQRVIRNIVPLTAFWPSSRVGAWGRAWVPQMKSLRFWVDPTLRRSLRAPRGVRHSAKRQQRRPSLCVGEVAAELRPLPFLSPSWAQGQEGEAAAEEVL